MWPFMRDKMVVPRPEDCLPGRAQPITAGERHFVNGQPLEGPYPAGMQQAVFGMGCFWGAERMFWETAGGLGHGRRLCRRLDAEPDLRGGVQRPHRPYRGGAGGLRSEGDQLRGPVEAVLGEPRPDPGDAPGQRRRDPVPLGDLHLYARAAPRCRGLARRLQPRLEDAGYGAITTEIADAPPFYFAEDYHQQYLAKNPHGYCGLGGTGVSCPIPAKAAAD